MTKLQLGLLFELEMPFEIGKLSFDDQPTVSEIVIFFTVMGDIEVLLLQENRKVVFTKIAGGHVPKSALKRGKFPGGDNLLTEQLFRTWQKEKSLAYNKP